MARSVDSTFVPASHGPVTQAIAAMRVEPEPAPRNGGTAGRRLFLAAAAALAFVPRLARAAEDHPDAALLALKDRWIVLSDAYERASLAASDLHGVGAPPMPETLLYRDDDADLNLHLVAVRRNDGLLWFWVRGDAEATLRGPQMRVRTVPVETSDKVHPGATHITKKVAWSERQARADEIVAAWDGWMADIQAAQDDSGYTAMRAEADRLCAAASAIEDEMEAMTPRTLDGLAALAAYARRVQADADDEDVKGGMLARAILAVAAVSAA